MRIEEGKYYKTRSGKKVGPAEATSCSEYPWDIPHESGFYAYTAEGESCLGWRDDDVVEEWAEKDTEEMTYKTWGEMTPEEKGALLLAHHEGKAIEFMNRLTGEWTYDYNPFQPPHCKLEYRVKPEEPRVEEKVFDGVYLGVFNIPHTYSIEWGNTTKGTATVTYTDGKPTKMVWECI